MTTRRPDELFVLSTTDAPDDATVVADFTPQLIDVGDHHLCGQPQRLLADCVPHSCKAGIKLLSVSSQIQELIKVDVAFDNKAVDDDF